MAGYPVMITAEGVALDPCFIGLPVSVTHGRASIANAPDAPELTFTYLGATCPLEVGDQVALNNTTYYESSTWGDIAHTWGDPAVLWAGGTEASNRRFLGHINSLVANEDKGQVVSWAVSAVGRMAQLGLVPLTLNRPAETDVQRVQAIAAAAGITVTIRGTSTLQVVADAEISGNALELLQTLCVSSAGLFWQAPNGDYIYGTANHRAVDPRDPSVIPCEVIEDGLSWARDVDLIVNQVTIAWGPKGTQQKVTISDSASISKPWKLRHSDVTTILSRQADADALGAVILARRAWPYWGSPTIQVIGRLVTTEVSRVLAKLDVSTPILVPFPMDEPGPVPDDLAPAIVEGWVETWDRDYEHTLQIAAGDLNRWVVIRPRTWNTARLDKWSHWRLGSWVDMLVEKGAA